MNQRRFPRCETEQEVRVLCLEQSNEAFAGRLKNFSSYGVRLNCPKSLSAGSLIKVEWGEAILLGEVVYCQSQGDEFVAGVEVEEIVYRAELAVVQGHAGAEQPPRLPAAAPEPKLD